MKIKTKPVKLENGEEQALIEITNTEVKAMLEATRWYIQGHKKNPDEATFKEMWDAEVDLDGILDILHGRVPYRNE